MSYQPENKDNRKEKDLIDYLFYALAGSAFAAISYSFLLWLQI